VNCVTITHINNKVLYFLANDKHNRLQNDSIKNAKTQIIQFFEIKISKSKLGFSKWTKINVQI
jgi:hypothetical protein